MFFLNLTAGEFFALFGVLGGLITALYLLDRSKRKKVVSTLRFWTQARSAEEQQSRRRMRDPWSLLLQIAGLLLLLLAIAQLQWGSRERRGRDHVLLLDTSAWSTEKGEHGTVLQREKEAARDYLASISRADRVMIVRVDSLAAPVTSFTVDRAQSAKAIEESQSGYSALNLEQALSLAQQALSWSGGTSGEIVYIGPRMNADDPSTLASPDNLRAISIDADRNNVGIRRMGVKRNEDDASAWQATVTLKNFGSNRRAVRLKTQFAGTVFGPRSINLAPNEEVAAEYNFVTNTAGELRAEVTPHDGLPEDDIATLRLPKGGTLHVAVYTRREDALRPLLSANHQLSVKFYSPGQFGMTDAADLVVFDEFAPKSRPKVPSLWIAPPRDGAPLPVTHVVEDAVVKNWHNDSSVGEGLHAKDAHISNAEVFEVFEGDIPVASVAAGPIAVARPASQTEAKTAVIGFDPLQGQLKFEVTTPILFANLLRWLAPDSFRTLELSASQVGAVTIALDRREYADRIRVTDQNGFAVPFTIRPKALQLFAGKPSLVHIVSDDRDRFISLTLPDVAEFEWKPPSNTKRGLPVARGLTPVAVDLWKWLAICGAACLLAEWLLYGRQRATRFGKSRKSKPSVATEAELVSK